MNQVLTTKQKYTKCVSIRFTLFLMLQGGTTCFKLFYRLIKLKHMLLMYNSAGELSSSMSSWPIIYSHFKNTTNVKKGISCWSLDYWYYHGLIQKHFFKIFYFHCLCCASVSNSSYWVGQDVWSVFVLRWSLEHLLLINLILKRRYKCKVSQPGFELGSKFLFCVTCT